MEQEHPMRKVKISWKISVMLNTYFLRELPKTPSVGWEDQICRRDACSVLYFVYFLDWFSRLTRQYLSLIPRVVFLARPRRLTVMSLAVRFLANMWLFHYAFMIVISTEHDDGGELDTWLEYLVVCSSSLSPQSYCSVHTRHIDPKNIN